MNLENPMGYKRNLQIRRISSRPDTSSCMNFQNLKMHAWVEHRPHIKKISTCSRLDLLNHVSLCMNDGYLIFSDCLAGFQLNTQWLVILRLTDAAQIPQWCAQWPLKFFGVQIETHSLHSKQLLQRFIRKATSRSVQR